MAAPSTPAELRAAYKALVDVKHPHYALMLIAIDELIDKLEAVYCGAAELTSIDFLFGKVLFEALEEHLRTK